METLPKNRSGPVPLHTLSRALGAFWLVYAVVLCRFLGFGPGFDPHSIPAWIALTIVILCITFGLLTFMGKPWAGPCLLAPVFLICFWAGDNLLLELWHGRHSFDFWFMAVTLLFGFATSLIVVLNLLRVKRVEKSKGSPISIDK